MGRILKSLAATLATAVIVSPALAADAGLGQTVFKSQCSICHSAVAGTKPGIGPTLFGVVGRKAGSVAGYNYSSAMKSAGFNWTDSKLRTYLPAPQNTVHGTKMAFGGVHDPKKLDNLLAYLAKLK